MTALQLCEHGLDYQTFCQPCADSCEHPIDEWKHEYDEDSILGDSYYCGLCGELTQVG